MGISTSDMSPADIRACTEGNSGGMGWGGDWFAWIIIFALIFGWGGNGFGGWGGNGGATGSVIDGYVLTSDFANIERKLDGVNNGLSDGFYAMNTGMLNGFNGVNQTICSEARAAEQSRNSNHNALVQQLFNMQTQAASCCCETREAIQGVNYNMATQACDTRNLVQNTTRDIIDAMNNGFRGIDQRLTAQELAAKDARIAEQNQRLFMAELSASQAAQNNYLLGALRPTPNPAYLVQNPNCCYQPCGCGG